MKRKRAGFLRRAAGLIVAGVIAVANLSAGGIAAYAESPSRTTSSDAEVQFTQLNLYEGSPNSGGTFVCDLLTDGNPQLTFDEEYYIAFKVAKQDSSDDAWVTISLPWWIIPGNMPGGSAWNTVGTKIEHTSIDEVIAYTEAQGKPNAWKAGGGTVTYHLTQGTSSDLKEAGFQISFTPSSLFGTGSKSQEYTDAVKQLSFSCGLTGSTASDSVTTSSISLTPQSTWQSYTANDVTQYTNLDTSTKAEAFRWTGPYFKTTNGVFTSITFDAVYPTNMVIDSFTFFGVEAVADTTTKKDNGDGTTTVHYTVTPSGGSCRDWTRTIRVFATFPSEYFPSDQTVTETMHLQNIKVYIYGDEQDAPVEGSADLKWILANGVPSVKLSAGNSGSRYNWLVNEAVDQETRLAVANLRSTGGKNGSYSNAQTISWTIPDGLAVHYMTVPLFHEYSDQITINGTVMDLSTAAQEIVENSNGLGYALISAEKAGVEKISSVVFNVGGMGSGWTTYCQTDRDNPDSYGTGNSRLAIYGSYETKNKVDTELAVYDTGTEPGSDNTTYQKETLTATPTDSKVVSVGIKNYKITTSSGDTNGKLIAGESVTISEDIYAHPYVSAYGSTTAWDKEPAVYAAVPASFSLASIKVGGSSITGEDITSECSNVPEGMHIYKFQSPEGSTMGFYNSDMKPGTTNPSMIHVEIKLYTSGSLSAQTWNLGNTIMLGTGTSDVQTSYIGGTGKIDNTYGIPNTGTLAGLAGNIQIQERKTLDVSNSMTIIKNGDPLDEELSYDPADPVNTRGVVGDGFEADYAVTVFNNPSLDIQSADIYIPIPKKGQNFGTLFNPEGSQEFSLNLEMKDSLPEGWSIQYLKIADDKEYNDVNSLPAEGDYTVVDLAQANMIRLTYTASETVTAKSQEVFHFKVTADTDTLTGGAVDTWNPAVSYTIGTSTYYPTALNTESLEVTAGMIDGYVYSDDNNNGVQDDGESGIADVTVNAIERWNNKSYTRTAVTNEDGYYSFVYIRGLQTEGTSGTSVDIKVNNPDKTTYNFSPTTTEGNHPSSVTPTEDQASAYKTGITFLNTNDVEVDAGLSIKKPELELSGTKTLKDSSGTSLNSTITADEFSFNLGLTSGDSNAVVMPEETTASTEDGNDDGAVFTFGKVTFTAAGTYTFKITENSGSETDVTYDSQPVTVDVTVESDGTKLVITKQTYTKNGEEAESINFENIRRVNETEPTSPSSPEPSASTSPEPSVTPTPTVTPQPSASASSGTDVIVDSGSDDSSNPWWNGLPNGPDANRNRKSNINTGVQNNAGLYAGILAAAVVVIIIIAVKRRKK
jgi:pilin isopeptide linkage protein